MRVLRTGGLFAGALVAACAVGACSGGGDVATTTIVTSSTVAPTLPTLPKLHFGSAEEAIRHLFLQWQAGDREAAQQAATADAVATLFARPVGENKFRGCSHPNDKALGSDCTYQYGEGLLQMHVDFQDDTWIVTRVLFQD